MESDEDANIKPPPIQKKSFKKILDKKEWMTTL